MSVKRIIELAEQYQRKQVNAEEYKIRSASALVSITDEDEVDLFSLLIINGKEQLRNDGEA